MSPTAERRTTSLPDARMRSRCLAWLAGTPAEDLPVLLFSGGRLAEDARYHVCASRPRFTVSGNVAGAAEDGGARLRAMDRGARVFDEAPATELCALLRRLARAQRVPRAGRDVPYGGGYFGAFGYDLAWLFEYGLPRYRERASAIPDLWLGWYDAPIVLDRVRAEVTGPPAELDAFLAREDPEPPAELSILASPAAFHREEYEAAVERIRGHCQRGELFQADLSRRISLELDGEPVGLFARLVEQSPAAYAAYLGLGHRRAVLSASPEEFLRLEGSRVRSRPIKGTRPRAPDPDEDERLAAELCASEKDRAELTMIVDLVRNDLGRVAVPGSVRVRGFPTLLSLPYVHHLVAGVEAELEPGRDVWDLLAATFPPGSISGAPKPAAVEILERVERSRRGVYTGAIGWIGASGDARLCVAIRTAEWEDGALRFGVGGGITVASDPALEYEETRDKARGLARALGIEGLA